MTSLAESNRWRAFGVLAAAQFVVILDLTIVNVALPDVQGSLHLNQTALPWVVNAYTLLLGGLLLLGGRLADLLGRRPVMLAGTAVFTASSLLGGLAGSEELIIAARALQGVGAALLSPAALSLVTHTFTRHDERTKALALWGALGALGGTGGVLLGGVVVDLLSWRWAFFVNVPIGLTALALAPRLVPDVRTSTREGRRSFDLPGELTATAGLLLLVFALVDTDRHPWGSTRTLLELGPPTLLLIGFLFIESRTRRPLVPLALMRPRALWTSAANLLLLPACFIPVLYFLTLWAQRVVDWSPLQTGLAFFPIGLFIIACTGIAQQLVTRFGARVPLAIGAVFNAAAMLLFTTLSADSSFLSLVLPGTALMGIGIGFSLAPVTITVTSAVDEPEFGVASGVLTAANRSAARSAWPSRPPSPHRTPAPCSPAATPAAPP